MKIRNIIATLFLVILCAGLVSIFPGAASAQQLNYYLTKNSFAGNKALTACASGYHMASFAELSAPGTLHYLSGSPLAYHQGGDEGGGPPLYVAGYIRTGDGKNSLGNCDDWTTSSSSVYGTGLWFDISLGSGYTASLQVYIAGATYSCSGAGVWCIEN